MATSKSKSVKTETVEHVNKVLCRFAAQNPDPKCELFYLTDYQLLVSVILSAQATDKAVNQCMSPLYEKNFGPDTVLELGRLKLQTLIKKIGLYKNKSRNIFSMTKILLAKHGGKVPDDRKELEALPGVGRKTASVVLGELFNEPTLAVDTHVFRVTRRIGWQREKTPEKAQAALLKVINRKYLPKAHHWLVLHGRYICKARKPLCDKCLLNDICPSAFSV